MQERLATVSTKFHNPRFLSIADYHYIMAPRGVVLTEMIPSEWGLLEPGPTEIVAAPVKAIRKNTGIVSNVLRAVARANATAMMRAHGGDIWYGGCDLPTITLQRKNFPTRSHAAGRKHGCYTPPGG